MAWVTGRSSTPALKLWTESPSLSLPPDAWGPAELSVLYLLVYQRSREDSPSASWDAGEEVQVRKA